MATRRIRPAATVAPIALAVTLATVACDDLLGGDPENGKAGQEQTDAKVEDAKPDDDTAPKTSDADTKRPKPDTKTEDTKSADTTAETKETPPDTPDVEDESTKPIVLTDISVGSKGGLFGNGALEIKARGKLNEKIDSATYVQAKTVCKDGNRFLADTGFVNADYRKPLQDHEVGETADLTGRFFNQGIEKPMSPCQVEFRLAGAGGGISIPLKTACYDGSLAQEGPCTPPVAAAAMSMTGGKPMEVVELSVKKPEGFGSRGGLNTNYILEVREAQDNSTRLTLKASCQVGDKKFVDVGMANLMAGPFKFESGESVARSAPLFFNPAFGFAESPALCDLEVSMWRPKKGSFGESEEILLRRSCFRDGKVSNGVCDPSVPTAPPPAPVTADSVKLENVVLEVVEPYGSKGERFQLKVQADAVIEKPVDQFSSVNAKVTCKVGKTARVETAYLYGVELYYLDPGETTRMNSTTFTSASMEKQPGSCEAEFTAGRRFAPSGEENVLLGKWCLKKGKMKKGKC